MVPDHLPSKPEPREERTWTLLTPTMVKSSAFLAALVSGLLITGPAFAQDSGGSSTNVTSPFEGRLSPFPEKCEYCKEIESFGSVRRAILHGSTSNTYPYCTVRIVGTEKTALATPFGIGSPTVSCVRLARKRSIEMVLTG